MRSCGRSPTRTGAQIIRLVRDAELPGRADRRQLHADPAGGQPAPDGAQAGRPARGAARRHPPALPVPVGRRSSRCATCSTSSGPTRWSGSSGPSNATTRRGRSEHDHRSTRRPCRHVVASVRIAAPPEVVFPYFTDPALVTQVDRRRRPSSMPGPAALFAIDVRRQPGPGRPTSRSTRPAAWCSPGASRARATCPPGSSTVEVVLAADGRRHRRHPDAPRPAHRGLPPLAPGGLERVPRHPGRGGSATPRPV